jgi:hypothetical protein
MKFKNYLFAAIGLALLASVVALSSVQNGHGFAAGQSDKNVLIVNTPTQAIPVAIQGTTNVTGNVNIENSPTVNAHQNGEWNVGFRGTPTVQVGNAPGNPVLTRDIDRPTAQPFQQNIFFNFGGGSPLPTEFISVPDGKVFVIEYISLIAQTTSPEDKLQFSFVALNGTEALYGIPAVRDDSNIYVSSQSVRIYATGRIMPRIRHIVGGSASSVEMTFSGYLVDR